MKALFFFLLYILTGVKHNQLPIETFITKNQNLQVSEITNEMFSPCDYLDTYSDGGFLWIQIKLPNDIEKEEWEVLHFGPEKFYAADSYVLQKDDSWLYAGSTGSGVLKKEKSLGLWQNQISISSENTSIQTNAAQPPVIRTRFTSTHSSNSFVYTTTLKNFSILSNFYSAYLGLISGMCIIVIIFTLFACITFKNFDSVFIAFVCVLLLLHVWFNSSNFSFLLWDFIRLDKNMYKASYFISCWILITIIIGIDRSNQSYISNFPHKVCIIFNFIPSFAVLVSAVGFVYSIVNISDHYGKFIKLISMTACITFFSIQIYYTIKYAPQKNKSSLSMLILTVYMFYVQELFHVLRFMRHASPILRFFDSDMELPETTVFFLLAATALSQMYGNIHNKLAQLQIQTEEVCYQIDTEKRNSFIFNNLSSQLLNSLHVFSSVLNRIKSEISPSSAAALLENIENSQALISAINTLSASTNSSVKSDTEREEINIHQHFTDKMKFHISNLRLNNCFVDINENFPQTTNIFVHKEIVNLMINSILQTVNRLVISGTTILISLEYINYTLVFSVHFSGKPVSVNDSQIIMELKNINNFSSKQEEKHFFEVIENWGVQLQIAKSIMNLYNGNISMSSVPDGITISARMAVPLSEPQILLIENNENTDLDYKSNIQESSPIHTETVFLLEEDAVLRQELAKLLQPHYKVHLFSNGETFFQKRANYKPDLILCSNSLPGKNALDLLKQDSLKNAPFFVLSQFTTDKAIINYLKNGATDVIQKPFDFEKLLLKIDSILDARRHFAIETIETIRETLQKSLFLTAQNTETEIHTSKIDENKTNINHDQIKEEVTETKANLLARFKAAKLTKKETSIASLIAEGKTDKEIAVELNVASSTVAVHNKKIFKKLGIHSRSQLFIK